MDIKKAKELIEETSQRVTETNTVMRGLQILAKYEEDVRPEFDHDIIWASNFEKTVSQMSEEEVAQMARLGWFCDEEYGCWAHF